MTLDTQTAASDLEAEARRFRYARSSFPSGVTIVTTVDPDGNRRGFTATSFCVVSNDPPLVLVCLATTAECHSVFATATRWKVHVIGAEHQDLAMKFATRGAEKFADPRFAPDEHGLPALDSARITLDCETHAIRPGGDHSILIGLVQRTNVSEQTPPAVYFRRGFHELTPCD